MPAARHFGLLLCSLTLASGVRAGQLRCASHQLGETDRGLFDTAMHAALPKGAQLSAAPKFCSNGDFARSFMETKHQANDLGFEQWWQIYCERGFRTWTCVPTPKQATRLQLRIDGLTRDVSVEFDEGTSVDTVRKLTRRVFELFDSEEVVPYCREGGTDPIESASWKSIKARNRPGPHDIDLNALVQYTTGIFQVDTNTSGGLSYRFSPDQLTSEPPIAECFFELIVVA